MAQNNDNVTVTNITAPINVMSAVPNVDHKYGPYEEYTADTEHNPAYNAYLELERTDSVAVGLTVGITTESGIVEYWFKNGTTEHDLIPKVPEEGVTDYNDLENKPKIGSTTLTSTTTLSDIGAASNVVLSDHTNDPFIHTYMYMRQESHKEIITDMVIEGNKLIVKTKNNTYNYALTTWVDIADFYVLFGNVTYSSFSERDTYTIMVNGTPIPFNEVTAQQFLTLADDPNGHMIREAGDKIDMTLTRIGHIKCDCVISNGTYPNDTTALMVMGRSSIMGEIPRVRNQLQTIAYSNELDGGYYYSQTGDINRLNSHLERTSLEINGVNYTIRAYFDARGLSGNDFGINFANN